MGLGELKDFKLSDNLHDDLIKIAENLGLSEVDDVKHFCDKVGVCDGNVFGDVDCYKCFSLYVTHVGWQLRTELEKKENSNECKNK